MFRVENNVPEVYRDQSRDFQLFSRLYDLAFQQVRQSCDSLQRVTETACCNAALLPLLSTRLGFFQNLNLPDSVYRQVLAAFPLISKYKGSAYAIHLVVILFEKIVNTKVEYDIQIDHATIEFFKYAPSAELLSVLLEYVRPTGYVIEWVIRDLVDVSSPDYLQNDSVYVSPKINSSVAGSVFSISPNGTTDDEFAGHVGVAHVSQK